ncbi:MAG: trehalose-phosphatase [Chloroflexi bacterium]|nr:trehalose-phosphatase [Chloroflexota bacterium]
MPHLFDHLSSVARVLSYTPLGLITDVDGTISPIAPSPYEARISSGCRQSLARLARHLALVAAISGRRARELRHLVGLPGLVYVGNHGLERWHKGKVKLSPRIDRYRPRVVTVLQELAQHLTIPGVYLEDKGVIAAIHYRRCPQPDVAREAILAHVSEKGWDKEFLIMEGRRVVELRPALSVNKGTVVTQLAHEYRLRGILYMGDDTTDVDAFRALRQLKEAGVVGYAVGVVEDETPGEVKAESDLNLRGVAEVERFLEWLVSRVAMPGPEDPQTGDKAM